MIEHLQLGEEDRLADVGCGTGIYTLDIPEQVPLRHPALSVDPYPEMLPAIPEDANVIRLAMDAFSRRTTSTTRSWSKNDPSRRGPTRRP